ncbi:hypothetical protein LJ737_03840 [Hymenobacter sp. 15J16-1T3B]|uniref:hypothetical protein n=1 Tax=Hymenobacter sp. 15J16-1T3B TaxID=2886941 RepID=UPI001D10DA53|nr:hypothetical protein [Hymenobacter sp. 15J16-1T3B]MCC3156353.1 hypothetical protein [Hymenobacter sp. 15J16-1T3B]
MRFSTPRFICLAAGAGALSGLLSSCAGTKPAFSFQPAPVTASPPTSPAPPPAAAAPVAAPAAPSPARPNALPVSVRPASRHWPAHATPAAAVRRTPLVRLQRPASRHQARRPADEGRRPHDTLHIILGALLILGSVAVGLWLGGWLGLGVGAAIMLLGDYFLVLGIGGKHAWQEIFQEFFNM